MDVIGAIRMSIQSFTKLVGDGSKSDDLRGASRTRHHTSSALTQARFCKIFLVSGAFSRPTRVCKAEGKEEWMTEIFLMKIELKVFTRATIEEWFRLRRSNKGISLSVSRVKTNTGARGFHCCAPSLEHAPAVCLLSHFSWYLQETSHGTSL